MSSNLNRHVRRCKEKWPEGTRTDGGSDHSATPVTPTQDPLPIISPHDKLAPPFSSPAVMTTAPAPRSHKRKSSSSTDDAPVSSTKRRKSPPAKTWVPESLRNFDHKQKFKAASTPLPPVIPSIYEERNSYDRCADETPYQSSSWKGRLVGPCYTISWRGYEKVLVF